MRLLKLPALGIVTLLSTFMASQPGVGQESAPSAQPQDWQDAYSRRSFKLGMPLEEFKSTAHPDDSEAYAVCSDEPRSNESGYSSSVVYSDAFKRAGLVTCSFYRTHVGSYSSTVLEAGLGLGNESALTTFWFINPDDSDRKYLAWIQTAGPTHWFDSLVSSFKTAYGEPTKQGVERWQNRAGAEIDNDVYLWANDVSEISFRRHSRKMQIFDLEHRLKPLMAVLNTRLEDQAASAAGRL